MSVGLLIVSHSAKIAEGICELAAQMASDVELVPAGGTDDGGIGTSFEKIHTGIASADTGDGLLILADLGSAVMTAESALEFLAEDQQQRIRLLPDVPLVEGAVAAAVAAQAGADLDAVARAARSAVVAAPAQDDGAADAPASLGADDSPSPGASGEAGLINPMGLHARPAAALAQALTAMDTEVIINGVDAKSVMLLMTLGLKEGQSLTVEATGADAQRAVDFVLSEAARGFGEMEEQATADAS